MKLQHYVYVMFVPQTDFIQVNLYINKQKCLERKKLGNKNLMR